jgi:hypothetical protein
MEWYKRTDETHTHLTDDGFIVVLHRVRTITIDGEECVRDWQGSVSRDNGAVMMTATDTSRAAVIAAIEAWFLALSVARERDPMPTP